MASMPEQYLSISPIHSTRLEATEASCTTDNSLTAAYEGGGQAGGLPAHTPAQPIDEVATTADRLRSFFIESPPPPVAFGMSPYQTLGSTSCSVGPDHKQYRDYDESEECSHNCNGCHAYQRLGIRRIACLVEISTQEVDRFK